MKVGLVLSGGGARCIAQLGMIQALEEQGIKFSAISGASAGAIVGTLYSSGLKPKEILDIVLQTNFLKILKPAFNWHSLLKLENAANLFQQYLPEDDFESLNIPMVIAATDLKKSKIKYFKKGPIIRPLIASCSIPVVFDPVRISRNLYIDGGVLDNLPVKPIKKKTDFLIAMHVNPIESGYRMSGWKDLMERSLLMAISSATYHQKKKCDIFWEPEGLSKFKVFDYKKGQKMFEIGYNYGLERIEKGDLKQLLVHEGN